jgi:hypothetical protein
MAKQERGYEWVESTKRFTNASHATDVRNEVGYKRNPAGLFPWSGPAYRVIARRDERVRFGEKRSFPRESYRCRA